MIKIEQVNVFGWEAAIRGMRNPMNSWAKSDTVFTPGLEIGENDISLMKNLSIAGPVHAKFRRMIMVSVDITAPLYWWKEFDTYKVGTVANSTSTMHKIHSNTFSRKDFSTDHMTGPTLAFMDQIVKKLEEIRLRFVEEGKKEEDWYDLIQLLPSSYNQKRTVMLNYEVLAGIYPMRKEHKLDEWRDMCEWIASLPYAKELICIGND